MKSSKRVVKDYQLVGTPGLPVNNFSGAQYLSSSVWTGLGLSTTTLYGWRAGASGFSTIQGAENLTEQGALLSQVDHLGNAVDCGFLGTQYLNNTSASFNFTGSFSVGVWIYSQDYSKASGVVVGRGVWWLQIIPGSNLVWRSNSSIETTYPVESLAAGWHFIAVSRTGGGSTKMYVDGVLVSAAASNAFTASGNLEVGSVSGGTSEWKNGRITDLWIHNATAWTDAQVMAIYTASLPNHTHDQQFAGHVPSLVEPGISNGDVLALYQFKNSNILTDETGSYNLSNTGTVVNDNGLFGINTNGAYFPGNGSLYNTSLWNTVPDKSLTVEATVMILGPNPTASTQYFIYKSQTSGNGDSFFLGYDVNNGLFYFNCNTVSPSKSVILHGVTKFVFGQWYHVVASWDSIFGMRLFINGMLEAQDSSITTLMPNNTTGTNFIISDYGGGTRYLNGRMGFVRVWNKILTQQDVDIAYSTRYDKTLFPANQLTELSINAKNEVQEWQTNFPIIAQDSNYIYRQGFTPGNGLKPGHRALIKGGY